MKPITNFFFFFICLSCTGQVDKNYLFQKLPVETMFYWSETSKDRLLAANLELSDTVWCNVYSFGIGQKNGLSRMRVAVAENNRFDLLNNKNIKEGLLTVESDTVIMLTLSHGVYRLSSAKNYEHELNRFRSKYSIDCIQTAAISFNGIVSYRTKIGPYLSDSRYKNHIEKYDDEIYGSGEITYLDYSGNHFFYTNGYFTKVEIFNDSLESYFLDIYIGDARNIVAKKLHQYNNVLRFSRSTISATVCNSESPGNFGRIVFRFKKTSNQPATEVLASITYEPFYDGE